MLAMILAGGQGTRLGKLTKNIAKPAVPFGGRYRIIDFTLSNCVNSGIKNVGVVTQYQPLALNSHIGNGSSWGLDGINTGVTILQPYSNSEGGKWFEGTAHAIYQNIAYIDEMDPQYVLVLSGDHIYKMDYEEMLEKHKENDASLTVAVLEVPMKDASRFGIMNTDKNDRIIEFDEKPAEPKSNLASMGIYIFNWKLLRKMLLADMKDADSNHDFGKDIIPTLLNDQKRLYAYKYKGYWKDVGTIDSLWEANMDLLDKNNELDLNDPTWKIYTEDGYTLPHYVGPNAEITNAFITQGCILDGEIKNSVLFTGAKVGTGAKIIDSVLMPGVEVGEGAVVTRALVADGIKIDKNTVVGDANSEHIELVAKHVKGAE